MADTDKSLTGYNGDLLIKADIEYGPEATGVGAFTGAVPEWVICTTGITITTLEEYRDGVSTDVLAERGMTTGDTLPDNYILKSSTGAGFSRIEISGGSANAFRVAPVVNRNFTDSVNSGINYLD